MNNIFAFSEKSDVLPPTQAPERESVEGIYSDTLESCFLASKNRVSHETDLP